MTNPKDAPANLLSELWNANDAARYLRVSRSWVYQHAESGDLPCLRVGGLVRFDPEVVRAFARGETRRGKVVPFPPEPSGKSG